jgi:hypothetical protein
MRQNLTKYSSSLLKSNTLSSLHFQKGDTLCLELTDNKHQTLAVEQVGQNMSQLSSNRTARRGRVFPERQLSPEEKARRKAEDEVFYRRCRVIFERVQPELIKAHYDWFIVIEPESGDYFIDLDETLARQKARAKHPHAKRLIMRLNETGTCGRI